MSKKQKKMPRPKARLPKGLRDVGPGEARGVARMLAGIREVYESYGFEPLETPAFEYTDALGKFLPDQDRPNEGVFSFEDEDGQWLSLRYDLTAPLARYVAQNYDALPKPLRRYQTGPVWRNEKPGPGRFREFTQFDADTVGAPGVAADAEMCMMAADCMEALGLKGKYVIRVNSRKVLDGLMETIGLGGEANAGQRLTVLRAIDKLDRLGIHGVRDLLGEGRKDESGDFTPGAGLTNEQITTLSYFAHRHKGSAIKIEDYTLDNLKDEATADIDGQIWVDSNHETLNRWEDLILGQNGTPSHVGMEGINELRQMVDIFSSCKYGTRRIRVDSSVVRGLDYYTGPVFEAELTFEMTDETGKPVRFGSVGGGGRYDGLVARFKGIEIPATGFSMGVSRLYAALRALGKTADERIDGPVVVLVMDKERIADAQKMAFELRAGGIRAEMYLGGSGMRAQMKYADKRGAPVVIIEGEDEHAKGEVTIKDLIEGARMSKEIEDNKEWREGRPAQVTAPRADLVSAVRDILARHRD